MRSFDLIIFDWDGTLMDSTGLIVDCLQAASHEVGLPVPSDARARYIIGLGIRDSTQYLFPDIDESGMREFAVRYRSQYLARDHEAPLFPGIREMLAELRKDDVMLAIATGKSRVGLDRAIAHAGIGDMIDFSRCADEGFAKPHPDMLLRLIDIAGVEKERVLMVGDTVHDLQLAANAGVSAVAVTYGAHTSEDLQRHPLLACLTSVAELREWLIPNT